MKSTPWRKPVGDCGGINELVKKYYRELEEQGTACHVDVILHAYREVGTSLECAIEIQYYDIITVRGNLKRRIRNIKFKNWVC